MDTGWGGVETVANSGVGKLPAGNLVTNLILTALSEGAYGVQNASGEAGVRAAIPPQAQAELQAMGEEAPEEPGLVDRYRTIRDTRKERTAAGEAQNPKLAMLGKTLGVGSTLFLPGPKVGLGRVLPSAAAAERVNRVLSAGASGATYGGINAATDGEADLTRGEVDKAATETVKGMLGGGAFGLGAGAAGEALRPLAGPLLQRALKAGRRVIGGDSDIAAATRKTLSDDAVMRALEERLIRPWSTTPSTYQRIEGAASAAGDQYGAVLKRLDELGVQGPRATELAAKFMRRANEMRGNMAASNPAPRTMAREARALASHGVGDGRIPLLVSENLKRDFQHMGRFERLNNSPREETFQELGSGMREAIENEVASAGAAGGASSEVAGLASRFLPMKSRLSDLLAARNVGERGASKALQKSPISLKDAILGAAAKDPASAAVTALVSAGVRNRLPSAMAQGMYGLSRGLRTGNAGAGIAAGGAEFASDAAQTLTTDDLADIAEWLASPSASDKLRKRRKETK